MGLNKAGGEMYEFVTHTWNTVKGDCFHNCRYCYMKKDIRHNEFANEPRLDYNEFRTDLGSNNFIFVGSGIDLFANDIPNSWIVKTLDYCNAACNTLFFSNRYLFQSKNPKRILEFIKHPVFKYSTVCTTIETNRFYKDVMQCSPKIEDRVKAMEDIADLDIDTYVTVEPIMDFDLDEMVDFIRRCKPKQVNIGKNTNKMIQLLEPPKNKVSSLINELQSFTNVHIKNNIKDWSTYNCLQEHQTIQRQISV